MTQRSIINEFNILVLIPSKQFLPITERLITGLSVVDIFLSVKRIFDTIYESHTNAMSLSLQVGGKFSSNKGKKSTI